MLLVLVSESSVASDWVHRELLAYLERAASGSERRRYS